MIRLYTTEPWLVDSFNDRNSPWSQLLRKTDIRVKIKVSSDYLCDNLVKLHQIGRLIDPDKTYLEGLLDDNSSISFIDDPSGIYFLDIEDTTASRIQNDYGVICSSSKSKDDNTWIFNDTIFRFPQIKEAKNWQQLLHGKTEVPYNSLVIVDRYLFATEFSEFTDEEEIEKRKKDTYKNIEDLLMSLVKKGLTIKFHILIIFDAETGGTDDFETINSKCKDILEEKCLSEIVTFELLSYSKSCYKKCRYYDKLHDRRIITNYFTVTATHKFNAFAPHNNYVCSQTVMVIPLCSTGYSFDSVSDSPEISHEQDLKTLINIKKEVNEKFNKFKYSINGEVKRFIQIKNRLIE